MEGSLKLLAFSFLAVILLGIGYDRTMVLTYKELFKDSLDISTKAAALQIDENEDKIGQGIFELDVEKARSVNEDILKKNVGEELSNYVVNTMVLNIHEPTLYQAPNGKKYNIDKPTVICSVKFPYKGIFINEDITLETLSASSIMNKNDLD